MNSRSLTGIWPPKRPPRVWPAIIEGPTPNRRIDRVKRSMFAFGVLFGLFAAGAVLTVYHAIAG